MFEAGGRGGLEYILCVFHGFEKRLLKLGYGGVVKVYFEMLGVVGLLSRVGLRGLCRVGLYRSIMLGYGLW